MINPNEILNYMRVYSERSFSTHQIATKFDISYREAQQALLRLSDAGRVVRIRNEFAPYVYQYAGDFYSISGR